MALVRRVLRYRDIRLWKRFTNDGSRISSWRISDGTVLSFTFLQRIVSLRDTDRRNRRTSEESGRAKIYDSSWKKKKREK